MKKIFAYFAALTLCTALLSSCTSSNDNDDATTTESTTSATVLDETTTEDLSEDSTGDEEILPDEDVNPDEDLTEQSENPLAVLSSSVINEETWPAMMEVTDETFIKEFFTIDVTDENIKEYIVMQCPMSSAMAELIVLKADDVEAAKEVLVARQEKAISSDAFYPNDVEIAGKSIVGSSGDYAYFIMSQESSSDEEALISAIEAL